MKFVTEKDDVLVGGALEIDSFTIKASASAFAILSAQLYSNKQGAVIRELSTNAYDAHIMVGTPEKPFELTLPNALEPTFKIRDFGPGLSEQQISSIYTTFFESTKGDSNDFVGCLGLGSKSPFAIADSFTVTSYYNGTKIIYSAFLSDARIPSIAKFGEFPTEEQNGLEIEVAVKDRDFYTFGREVNEQLKYFKVKPTIFGNSDFRWHDEEEYIYEGADWKLAKGKNSRVIQGQIQYPINTRDMGSVYADSSEDVKILLDKAFLFEVPIGDVNIAPSREALSYDDKTCRNIIKHAEKIIKELPEMIKEVVSDCTTKYEAKIKYKEVMVTLNGGTYYSNNALVQKFADSGNAVWNGEDISSTNIDFPTDKIISAVQLTKQGKNGLFRKSNFHASTLDYTTKKVGWRFEATELNRTFWVLTTDEDKAVESRVKQYVNGQIEDGIKQQNYGGAYYMVNIIRTELNETKLADYLGLTVDHIITASTLDKVRRNVTKRDKELVAVEVFSPNNWGHNKSSFWTVSTKSLVDFEQLTGYYVDLERYNVMQPDGTMLYELKSFVKSAIEVGILTDNDTVYGLRKSVAKANHKLVNLFDYIAETAKTSKLVDKYEWETSDVINKLAYNGKEHCAELLEMLDPIENSYMVEALTIVLKSLEVPYSQDTMKFIFKMDLHSEVVECTDLMNQASTFYPMIADVGYYIKNETIAQYIKSMDLLRSLTAV